MAGFIYFAQCNAQPTLETVRSWGLGYAFSSAPTARAADANTPAGGHGWTFGDAKRMGGREIKIAPGQVWRKIPGRGDGQPIWLGYWPDDPPTPEALARPAMLTGFPATMADGRVWQVPIVRSFDVATAGSVPLLPCVYDLDDEGQLVRGKLVDAHAWLWELTEPAWMAMTNEQDLNDQDLKSIAARLFGANYAVDLVELITLGVFSPDRSPSGIVSLAIDFVTWAEWHASQKKTTGPSSESTVDGSSTLPGETAADPTTPPLGQTS